MNSTNNTSTDPYQHITNAMYIALITSVTGIVTATISSFMPNNQSADNFTRKLHALYLKYKSLNSIHYNGLSFGDNQHMSDRLITAVLWKFQEQYAKTKHVKYVLVYNGKLLRYSTKKVVHDDVSFIVTKEPLKRKSFDEYRFNLTMTSKKGIEHIELVRKNIQDEYIRSLGCNGKPPLKYVTFNKEFNLRTTLIYPTDELTKMYFPGKDELIAILDRTMIAQKKFADGDRTLNNTKLSILLYGEPGCGKTSLIRAISKYTDLSVFALNLAQERLTVNEIKTMLHARNDGEDSFTSKIVVIEDIDCDNPVVNDRENKTDTENKKIKITLSDILNSMDGICQLTNTILIITTNYIEKLDKALIRDGRIDMKIEMKKMREVDAKLFIRDNYFPEFDEPVPGDTYTLATIATNCKLAKNMNDFIDRLRREFKDEPVQE
jgi:hypothetical protein